MGRQKYIQIDISVEEIGFMRNPYPPKRPLNLRSQMAIRDYYDQVKSFMQHYFDDLSEDSIGYVLHEVVHPDQHGLFYEMYHGWDFGRSEFWDEYEERVQFAIEETRDKGYRGEYADCNRSIALNGNFKSFGDGDPFDFYYENLEPYARVLQRHPNLENLEHYIRMIADTFDMKEVLCYAAPQTRALFNKGRLSNKTFVVKLASQVDLIVENALPEMFVKWTVKQAKKIKDEQIRKQNELKQKQERERIERETRIRQENERLEQAKKERIEFLKREKLAAKERERLQKLEKERLKRERKEREEAYKQKILDDIDVWQYMPPEICALCIQDRTEGNCDCDYDDIPSEDLDDMTDWQLARLGYSVI